MGGNHDILPTDCRLEKRKYSYCVRSLGYVYTPIHSSILSFLVLAILEIESLIGSRSYSPPSVDSRASFEILPKGTRTNTTHWQYTARCVGCTSFVGRNNMNTTLNSNGSNRIAYAWSSVRPSSTTPSSTISVHEGAPSAWSHDFSLGSNVNWSTLLMQNLGHS
jgi:hypothetical protein